MDATAVGSRLRESRALPGRALNWVDGKWMDAKQRAKSFDPATGEEVGTYADASREDAAAAIEAADRAFRMTDWKDNRKLRAKVLNQSPTGSMRGVTISSGYFLSKMARSATKRLLKWTSVDESAFLRIS